MKKIFIFVLTAIALCLFSSSVYAANYYTDGNTITISGVPNNGRLIIASYDGNGRLSDCNIYEPENGMIDDVTDTVTGSGGKIKAFLWDMTDLSPIEMNKVDTRPTPPEPAGSKTLVAYFSWTNHTEEIANYITEITGADKYEIVPKEPYGPENSKYYDSSTRAYQEQNDDTARPEIDGTVSNMEQYDIVFVGYPIWYGTAPKIIYTFLEKYDFAGKTVIPFCTSASNGIGSTSELQRLTQNANWLNGKRFNIGESKDIVKEWVDGLELDFGNSEEVENMALINGGTFKMGSPAGEAERDADEIMHSVTVDSFYMDEKELTQSEYQSVMGNNPSENVGDDMPVENVTWYDAIEYCNKRSQAEGLTPCYTVSGDTVTWDKSANGYRLPTEAEWEYAARANTDTPFNFGSYVEDTQANCYNAYGYNNDASGSWVNGYLSHTVAVDSYDANSYGLYNMHGNVGEWVWDWYGAYSGDAANPTGAEGGHYKVVRGGGWNDFPKHIRSAYRSAYPADAPLYSIGIRVARNASAGNGSVKSVNIAKTNEKANKTLIAYFSQTGNTDGLAKIIEEICGADIFRIERATPYSATSNSQSLYAEALNEQRENAIPDLKAYLEDAGLNIDDYDTILLGYCNWWASIPAPVRSFLTHYDMSGKTIIPFCSMGGGRFGQTISAVAKLCPDSAIKEGLDVTYSSYDRDEITAWLKASGVME